MTEREKRIGVAKAAKKTTKTASAVKSTGSAKKAAAKKRPVRESKEVSTTGSKRSSPTKRGTVSKATTVARGGDSGADLVVFDGEKRVALVQVKSLQRPELNPERLEAVVRRMMESLSKVGLPPVAAAPKAPVAEPATPESPEGGGVEVVDGGGQELELEEAPIEERVAAADVLQSAANKLLESFDVSWVDNLRVRLPDLPEIPIRDLRNAGQVLTELSEAGSAARVTSNGKLAGWLIPASEGDKHVFDLEKKGRLRRGRQPSGPVDMPDLTWDGSLSDAVIKARDEERA